MILNLNNIHLRRCEAMDFKLDLKEIQKKFNFNTSIKHNPKTNVEFFPYKGTYRESQFNFREVIGEFLRLVGNKRISSEVNSDKFVNDVLESIEFEKIPQKAEFKQMLKTLFIDDNNQLVLFHPQTLYYINTAENENKKLAEFLYAVLWNGETSWSIEKKSIRTNDLMSTLIFSALPNLEDAERQPVKYALFSSEFSELFMSDFKWLSTKQELFTQQFEKLLSYYYFFYVTQIARRNEYLFNTHNQNIIPLYFTFEEEERLSKTRVSYEYGWKNIERSVNRMFSHVNFLKMLNISVQEQKNFYSYQRIAQILQSTTPDVIEQLEEDLESLVMLYKAHWSDVNWSQMEENTSEKHELPILNQLTSLFQIIDYQFNNSQRVKLYNGYKSWFVHFCQKAFLKSRGRSGKMLILNTDYLLFLTKVIIKNESKIRLKRLLEEFEIRGIVFDRDTQIAIVEYFEKLNLLEKKSDSGDAIYVRAFL